MSLSDSSHSFLLLRYGVYFIGYHQEYVKAYILAVLSILKIILRPWKGEREWWDFEKFFNYICGSI